MDNSNLALRGRRTFSRADRLRKSNDFKYLKTEGASKGSKSLVFVWSKSKEDRSRLGMSVSRRVGNSAFRSGCKRLIREWFRHNRGELGAVDLHIIVRSSPLMLSLTPKERNVRMKKDLVKFICHWKKVED